MTKRKIVFLTGTRADFGKLKSILAILKENSLHFDVNIFITGMHMLCKYGSTYKEVLACNAGKCFQFINQNQNDSMDAILAKTISGFSDYVKEIRPEMIVVHGDRLEALAGAVVGSFNNILVAHIEGGEVTGTIDELIRHSVSKLSHIHFVSNEKAYNRLIQLGETSDSIFEIGSPDLDIMISNNLPDIYQAKKYYDINFTKYSILIYHPVTTEREDIKKKSEALVSALFKSDLNYIVIYPNNDMGSEDILEEYKKLRDNCKFKLLPSIRFEFFLTLLKHSNFIIGNSSAGVKEAPFYRLPSINIGSRQYRRSQADSIINCKEDKESILKAIDKIDDNVKYASDFSFGCGESNKLFLEIIKDDKTWKIPNQKFFIDIPNQ